MTSTILPGRTIGVFGGGQLGRMFALSARRLGYRIHVFDPTSDSPAGQVADLEITADYHDQKAARSFAEGVDVLTFEFENIPAETLAVLAALKPVHPSPHILHVSRHRLREKDYLREQGFPVTAYRAVHAASELSEALATLGTSAILKSVEFGYDGKGQVRIGRDTKVAEAWAVMGQPVGILEAIVPFDKEISVICARNAHGEVACFGPAENVHKRHILDTTVVPANLSATLAQDAIELAQRIAHSLGLIGLLTVEMFVTGSHILVNELAPRPHNSGHYTIDACVTDQFEQHVRAVCGLPLGDVSLRQHAAAMANLLGDVWDSGEPNWCAALALPQVKLHLYGKSEPRAGRKMGHVTSVGQSREEAIGIVTEARRALTPG